MTANDIEALDDLDFRRFMRELLRNESASCEGVAFIDNPGDGNERGQDAQTIRTSTPSGPNDTFIPTGDTIWQYKAERQPPSEKDMRDEMAKERPTEVLKAGGSYRFVAQQPRTNEREKLATLQKIAVKRKFKPEQVGFHAQATLAERARRYPALALLPTFRKSLDGLFSFEWWKNEHSTPFDVEARRPHLDAFATFMRSSTWPTHVRVVGPAGVGKTRFVLHALDELGLGSLTAYAASPNSTSFSAFFKWCRENRARLALVVDECDEANAMRMRGIAIEQQLPILLITINKVEDRDLTSTDRDLRIHLDPMSSTDIVRILGAFHQLGTREADAIARATGGFVKLAQVVAKAIVRGARVSLDASALITNDTVRDCVRSLLGDDANVLRWLGVVSLFSEVHAQSIEVGSDLHSLATFANVSLQDARAWNARATIEQILSDRGNRIFVTPQLLAVLLSSEVIHQRRLDLPGWLRGLPPRLQEAFATQLRQLRHSDDGQRLARELIGADGPFGDLLAVRQPWAREAFLALGTIARDEALSLLDRWTSDAESARELAYDSSLARLLFRIIWRPEHFAKTFKLVVRALNATTHPRESSLFRVLAGALTITLSNSRTPFLDRLAVAVRAFRADSVGTEVRWLILESLANGVGNSTGDGYSEDDIDVGGRTYWYPPTYGDWWACTRAVCNLLVDSLGDANRAIAERAGALLIDNADDFVRGHAHAVLLPAVERILAVDPRVGTLREQLEHAIAFEGVDPAIDQAVRAAIASLPQDLLARIRILAEGWPLFRDREERGLPERPDAVAVAQEIVESPNRPSMIAALFEVWAKNAGDLLVALARHPEASLIWPEVLAASRGSGQTWGASLFLAIAHEMHQPEFATVAVDLLGSEDDFTRRLGAEAITRMEATDHDVEVLVRSVQAGGVIPVNLRYGLLGRWAQRRSPQVVADLIRAIAILDRPTALDFLMATEWSSAFEDHEAIALLASALFEVKGNDEWTWERLAQAVAAREPRDLATALIVAIRTHAENPEHRYTRWAEEEAMHVLSACVEQVPEVASEILALWSVDPRFVESFGAEVLLDLGAETLANWASDDQRQTALAKIVPPSPVPLTIALLERWGPDSAFARRLRQELHPRSWNGSLAPILRSRAAIAKEWSIDAKLPLEFREWAQASAHSLERAAEQARRYDDD